MALQCGKFFTEMLEGLEAELRNAQQQQQQTHAVLQTPPPPPQPQLIQGHLSGLDEIDKLIDLILQQPIEEATFSNLSDEDVNENGIPQWVHRQNLDGLMCEEETDDSNQAPHSQHWLEIEPELAELAASSPTPVSPMPSATSERRATVPIKGAEDHEIWKEIEHEFTEHAASLSTPVPPLASTPSKRRATSPIEGAESKKLKIVNEATTDEIMDPVLSLMEEETENDGKELSINSSWLCTEDDDSLPRISDLEAWANGG